MGDFRLNERLARDTVEIGDLPLCRILAMDDARFPWIVLVPRRPALREIQDLSPSDRAVLIEEIAAASSALRAETGAEKMNVGALGNVVEQLHIHVVARRKDDAAWPGPVWGSGPAVACTTAALASLVKRIGERLGVLRI